MFRIVSTRTLADLREQAETADQARQEQADLAEQHQREAETARDEATHVNDLLESWVADTSQLITEIKQAVDDPNRGHDVKAHIALRFLRDQIAQFKAEAPSEASESTSLKLIDMLISEDTSETTDNDAPTAAAPKPPAAAKPYHHWVVLDAAEKLGCHEPVAELTVQLIATKHAAGWTAGDIATHLAEQLEGHDTGAEPNSSFVEFMLALLDESSNEITNRVCVTDDDMIEIIARAARKLNCHLIDAEPVVQYVAAKHRDGLDAQIISDRLAWGENTPNYCVGADAEFVQSIINMLASAPSAKT